MNDTTRAKLSAAKMGERNPRWNGGTSEYPDHMTFKKNRLIVLSAAHYTCKTCGGHAEIAHHANGDKSDHRIFNLIPYCKKCHFAIHANCKNKKSKYLKIFGFTLQEMSSMMGVSVPTICNVFNGKHAPNRRTAYKIEQFKSEHAIPERAPKF